MDLAKLRKSIVAAAAILAALVGAWFYARGTSPAIDLPSAQRLSAITDTWCVELPNGSVPPDEWPEEIRRLRPRTVLVEPDGLFIEMGSLFVESWGIFVLRSGSTLNPGTGTDPSFRLLQKPVYSYRIKG